jgi:uncharacterized glyoxalase superfamily protein PhnB
MPAPEYGRSMPPASLNLLVRDTHAAAAFHRDVLGAEQIYADEDFAVLRLGGLEYMLHADHTYETHAWHTSLTSGERRGLGAEIRLLGIDPDVVAARAEAAAARLLQPPETKPHGWREATVEDLDGYAWAVGVPA